MIIPGVQEHFRVSGSASGHTGRAGEANVIRWLPSLEGEVLLKSATFEWLIHKILERVETQTDRKAVNDALEIACLWADRLANAERERVVAQVLVVIGQALEDPNLVSCDELALAQLTELRADLKRRYRHDG